MARIVKNNIIKYIDSLYNSPVDNHDLLQLDDYHKSIALSDNEIRIVALILQLANVQTHLELGTLVGSSALALVKLLPNLRITSVEKSYDNFLIAKSNVERKQLESRIKLINADALLYLSSVPDDSFDAIFIDANKKAYPQYFEQALRVVKSGGIIIADNTLLGGKILDADNKYLASMHDFNKRFANSCQSVIITTDEGLSIGINP